MAKLVLKFDERVLGEYPIDAELTIGRLPHNSVAIDNPAVSSRHARIFVDGTDYIVEDLGSKNGTYVNEKHVVRAVLQHRDVLLVGRHRLVFDQAATAESSPTPRRMPTLGETAYLDTKKHRDLLARLRAERARTRPQAGTSSKSQTGAVLRVVDGQTDHPEYQIQSRISFIGSSDEALVRLHGRWSPKTAAAIVQDDAGFTVTDFAGSTLVNNQPLPEGTQQLKHGDMLEVGGLILEFGLTGVSPAESRAAAETA
jgi:pSer/pThr/pTyr-binding forkhead associated (FHA) protein